MRFNKMVKIRSKELLKAEYYFLKILKLYKIEKVHKNKGNCSQSQTQSEVAFNYWERENARLFWGAQVTGWEIRDTKLQQGIW